MPTIRVLDVEGKELGQVCQRDGEAIAAALRREGYQVAYDCGGRGICGKCRFRVMEQADAPTTEEKRLLTREELDVGIRLLCRTVFETDATIMLLGEEVAVDSIGMLGMRRHARRGDGSGKKQDMSGWSVHTADDGEVLYDVAVDIGTTTIALAIMKHKTKKILSSCIVNNSQRSYGADVLSRIQASNTGNAKALQEKVWEDVQGAMDSLLQDVEESGRIVRIAVAANTTMQHLFAGDSCQTLGVAPFEPVSVELRQKKAGEWYPKVRECYVEADVVLLPGISAFVGADILSGMCECKMGQSRRPVILLDVGTNGEIVLKTADGYLATAASAGPALEGGNISCGVPGIEGAINSVSLMANRLMVYTIQNKKPIGICGTGVLELVYELRKMGIIDGFGNLSEQYRELGYPVAGEKSGEPFYFTQEDIRQVQMAKSAIRSGIELLMKEGQLVASDIEKVYLAGGMGYKMNVYKAAGIGLIPSALREKAQAVGNSALAGAWRYLWDKDMLEEMENLRKQTKEMNLATHPAFEDHYYHHMNFVG